MAHTDTVPVYVTSPADATTEPPPGHEATGRALRAVGVELDVLGEEMTRLAAGVETLAEMGDRDHADQKSALARIESKLDVAIGYLRDQADRIRDLEGWRGEHTREHARQ